MSWTTSSASPALPSVDRQKRYNDVPCSVNSRRTSALGSTGSESAVFTASCLDVAEGGVGACLDVAEGGGGSKGSIQVVAVLYAMLFACSCAYNRLVARL